MRIARLGNILAKEDSLGFDAALEKDKTKSTAALTGILAVFFIAYLWKRK